MQHDSRPTGTAAPAGRRFTAAGLAFTLVTGGLLAGTFGHTVLTRRTDPPAAGAASTPGSTPGAGLGNTRTVAVSTFTDCSALLSHYRTHAADLVGPYGLPGSGGGLLAETLGGRAVAGTAAAGAAPAAARTDVGTTSATGTNVQVAGVDEADVAKRVGTLLYTAVPGGDPDGTGAALTVARTENGRSRLLGRLRLPDWQPSGLLVEGSTVLLVGGAPWEQPAAGDRRGRPFMPSPWGPARTRVVQVDVSDPAAPRVLRTLDVDGAAVGTRLVDGVARITVSGATNRLRFVQPVFPGVGGTRPAEPEGPLVAPPAGERQVKRAEQVATAKNRRVVAGSTIADWLPTYELTEGAGAEPTSSGRLLDCSDISAPDRFSGLDTMTMLSLDLRDPAGISRWDGAGVVASGAQLYATADRSYVATTPWQDWATLSPARQLVAMRAQRSQVHLFDTSGGASPVYVGSGEVPGFLLNQFAMDEHAGHLRVASTTMPDWWAGDRTRTVSTSQVTVLRVDDDGLTRTGAVTGLGRTETIRAVRFVGDVGYVVTFRQTDPLYTVDLADPARPRVTGELKILGYSAYLHPAGPGLLVGVGQDATKSGRTTGLQMALFDVSDPARPRRVDTVTLPGAWSDVEGDHHAFTLADGLALVPFTRWSEPGADPAATAVSDDAVATYDAGVVAVRLTGSGAASRFGEPTVLRATGSGPKPVDPTSMVVDPAPLRTFVGDGSVWTVTTGGVAAHDANTLRRSDFTRF